MRGSLARRLTSVLFAALALCAAAPIQAEAGASGAPAARKKAPATKKANKKEPPAIVTYVGFRAEPDGTATIYADVSATVTVATSGAGTSNVRFTMRGAKVALRNNTHPLLAQYFDSAVESARLIPDKDAVVLSVKLRRAVTPRHRIVEHAGGACSVVIEFPAGGG